MLKRKLTDLLLAFVFFAIKPDLIHMKGISDCLKGVQRDANNIINKLVTEHVEWKCSFEYLYPKKFDPKCILQYHHEHLSCEDTSSQEKSTPGMNKLRRERKIMFDVLRASVENKCSEALKNCTYPKVDCKRRYKKRAFLRCWCPFISEKLESVKCSEMTSHETLVINNIL